MYKNSLVNSTDYTQALTDVLDEYIDRHKTKAAEVSPYYATLWSDIARLVHSGGKKLRPKMTIMSYQAFGGKDVESILPIAAAQELLHVGLLIHDDIIDRDTIRYGVDNIEGSYQKLYAALVADTSERSHYAKSAATLAGDLLLTGAYRIMLESKLEAERVIEAQRILSDGIFEVIGGELIDTESVFRETGTIKSETVARYKTASYSFVAPLLIGAVLAGASHEYQGRIRQFAEAVGVAFQLRDDLIGLFGDESVTGKSTISDIREGKRTYLVEQFYRLADEQQKEKFEQHFGHQDVTDSDVEEVIELIIQSGARDKTEETILDLEQKAHQALDELSESVQTDSLRNIVDLATRRSK